MAKFGDGQRVSIVKSGAFSAPSGPCRVISALPLERGPQQYRVRSEAESFDRIIDEARLEALIYD